MTAEILITPPGALTASDRKALRDAGVVVVQTDDPSKCLFLRATEALSSSDMLWAAMDALRKHGDYDKTSDARERLAQNLWQLVAADFDKRHASERAKS